MTDKALAERLRKLAQAYRSVVVVDVTSINEATDLDRAADLIEQMAQAKPSRSERLREAGFTPRDKRIACDECGQLVSQQFLPIHKCEQRGEPVAWKAGGYLFFHRDEIPGDLLPPRQPEPQPLYTAPPAREPLSEEQIERVRASCVDTPAEFAGRRYGWAINFARAIEQAHGIRSEE